MSSTVLHGSKALDHHHCFPRWISRQLGHNLGSKDSEQQSHMRYCHDRQQLTPAVPQCQPLCTCFNSPCGWPLDPCLIKRLLLFLCCTETYGALPPCKLKLRFLTAKILHMLALKCSFSYFCPLYSTNFKSSLYGSPNFMGWKLTLHIPMWMVSIGTAFGSRQGQMRSLEWSDGIK